MIATPCYPGTKGCRRCVPEPLIEVGPDPSHPHQALTTSDLDDAERSAACCSGAAPKRNQGSRCAPPLYTSATTAADGCRATTGSSQPPEEAIEGRIKMIRKLDLPAHRSLVSHRRRERASGHQPCNRYARAADHHLMALLHLLQQPGQMGFRLVLVHQMLPSRFHRFNASRGRYRTHLVFLRADAAKPLEGCAKHEWLGAQLQHVVGKLKPADHTCQEGLFTDLSLPSYRPREDPSATGVVFAR